MKYSRGVSIEIFIDPSDTEIGWKLLGCGAAVHFPCDTSVFFFLLLCSYCYASACSLYR